MAFSEHDAAHREHRQLGEFDGAKSVMDKFAVNNIEEVSSTLLYIGSETEQEFWMIKRIDSTSGDVIRFATINNNPSIEDYLDAWDNKASLQYDIYSVAILS